LRAPVIVTRRRELRAPVVVYTEENEAHHLLNSSTSPNYNFKHA